MLPSLGDLFAKQPAESRKYYEVVRVNMFSLVKTKRKQILKIGKRERRRKMEIKIKAEEAPEIVALGVTSSFRIVVTENGAKREYIVDYKTDPEGYKSLLCVADGRVVFADESFCGAPISDYARIKECLAEQLGILTTELLEPM